jgi:TonB-linked SusC/RagA family outer membrane protein
MLYLGWAAVASLAAAAVVPLPGQDTAGIGRSERLVAAAEGTTHLSALARPAQLEIDDTPLAAALIQLQRSSGVSLAFSPSLIPNASRVTCHCASLNVKEALDTMLAGTGFTYAELGRRVIIQPAESSASTNSVENVAVARAASWSGTRPAQDVLEEVVAPVTAAGSEAPGKIQGSVTDASTGFPIPNAQIGIRSISMGALTNEQGEYSIDGVPAGTYSIVARIIGYRELQKSVTVADDQTVTADFALEKSALKLDEVVVTGTAGGAKRREVGNAISSISTADVAEPVATVDNLLQGRQPGVTVTANSGQVGGGASIRLRGNVSATQSNQPLIYIDGVRMRSDGYPKNVFPVGYAGNSDNTVYSPLNDIDPADIERVEVVKGPAATTLYGSEASAGVIQIFTKRGRSGATRWTFQTDQSLSQVRRFGPTQGFDGSALNIPAGEESPYGTPDYMYLEPWLGTGHGQKYLVSLSGGKESLEYFLSGSHNAVKGVLPNDKERQYSVRGNLTMTPLKNLTVQWNTGYSNNNVQRTPTGGTAAGITLNAFRRDRNYFGDANPDVISQVLRFDLDSYIDHFTTGATATYTPWSWMTNRATVGYDLAEQEARNVMPYGYVTTPQGQISDERWANRTLTFDLVSTLNFPLPGGIGSAFSVGAQSVTTDETSTTAASLNLPGPGVPTVSTGATSLGFEDRLHVVNAGFFFQNIFSLADRYFLTAGVRFDGNSAFGSGLGLQAYPKVSLSYIISDEPFWNPALGTLKLRAAYGVAGRSPGAFDAVRTWDPTSWGGQVSFLPRNLGNPDLGPERTKEMELGFDASVLNERLNLGLTYYSRRTNGALFAVRRPPSDGGWDSQLENVGKLKSSGLELSVDASVLRRSEFEWNIGGGLATNHSETVDLGGAAPFSIGNYGWVVPGQPTPVIRATCVTNPDEIADPVFANNCDIGPSVPTLTWNVSTTFRFPKGIELSARGDYQGGNYAYSLMDGESITRGIRWPACFNSYPSIDAEDLSNVTAHERAMCIAANAKRDFAIFPMDFFRLRDITIKAPIPASFLGASSTIVSFSVKNFALWKKAKDSFLDPETSGGFTTSGMNQAVHTVGGSIPIPASYVLSIRVVY